MHTAVLCVAPEVLRTLISDITDQETSHIRREEEFDQSEFLTVFDLLEDIKVNHALEKISELDLSLVLDGSYPRNQPEV